MSKIPYGRYSREFREGAVHMVVVDRLSAREVAKRLSELKTTMENRVRTVRLGKLADIWKNARQLSEIELKLARIKQELAETRMERDILKKSCGVLRKRVAARYAVISVLRLEFPVPALCQTLEVSQSGL